MTVTALRTTALTLLAVLATLGVFGVRQAGAAPGGVTDLAITAVCRFTPLVPDAEFPENLNTVLAITVANVGSAASTQPVVAFFNTVSPQKGPAQEIPNTNGLAPGAQKRFKLQTLWYSGLSPVKEMVAGIHGGGPGDPVENQRVYFANPYAIPAC